MTHELITLDALEVSPAGFVLTDAQLAAIAELLIWDHERGDAAQNKVDPPNKHRRVRSTIK